MRDQPLHTGTPRRTEVQWYLSIVTVVITALSCTMVKAPSGRRRTHPQFLQAPCALLQMIIVNSTHQAAQSVSRTLQLSRTTVPLVLFCITCHAARILLPTQTAHPAHLQFGELIAATLLILETASWGLTDARYETHPQGRPHEGAVM